MNSVEELNADKKFKSLSTSQLIEAYKSAKELNLSIDFQKMLANAIIVRQSNYFIEFATKPI
jgi:hypothetical protein